MHLGDCAKEPPTLLPTSQHNRTANLDIRQAMGQTQGPDNSGARRMGTSQSLLLTGHSYSAAAGLCCGKAQAGERKVVLGTVSREDLQHSCKGL